jgi:hypothetical protein
MEGRGAVVNVAASIMAVALILAFAAAPVYAHESVSIHEYSQATSPANAQAGASVHVSSRSPGAPGGNEAVVPAAPASYSYAPSAPAGGESGSGTSTGPGTLTCETWNRPPCALPPAAPPTRPAAGASQPPVSPAALATAAAGRISLVVGGIQASPSVKADGLTGAASWFWLSLAPASRSVSVSARGEQVTVSASVASVRWSFGDGASLLAGPGAPYRPGSIPTGAVRHVYQTRCLPGDRGHDPNVLSSCGADGYTVEAVVLWAIGYTASGPIAGGGALPSRSTTTSIAYPVSEARAFLTTEKGEG